MCLTTPLKSCDQLAASLDICIYKKVNYTTELLLIMLLIRGWTKIKVEDS